VARVLLLLPTTTYRAPDFLKAAEKLGVAVTVASEEASTLEGVNPSGLLTLDFRDPQACAKRVAEFARDHPVDSVIGVDEETSVATSAIAATLGLPHNPIPAAAAAGNKAKLRETLSRAGVPSPAYLLFHIGDDPEEASREVRYPCVLKPTFLAASRGVIRANGKEEFLAAWERIGRILREPEVQRKGGAAIREVLVEEFVPGEEVAVEGLLRKGELQVLTIFDKPDPLEGPFFEETIYVTPSRMPEEGQRQIAAVAAQGCAALGLAEGPVHAELRYNRQGPWLIELAARSIGGLCSRTLRFGTGMSLEELILRHALGMDTAVEREKRAAAVLMIPILAAGNLEEVRGLSEARAVAGIEEVTISAHVGQRLVPLPEGSRYLGFIFSRADRPEVAERALREAHRKLEFVVAGGETRV